MSTLDTQDRHRFERRLGRRVDVDPVEVTWVVPRSGRWGRRAPATVLPGRIENVSPAGAAIVAPADLDLAPGSRAMIRSEGHDSAVVVRHRSVIDGSGAVRYGVELAGSDTALRQQVRRLVEAVERIEAVEAVEAIGSGPAVDAAVDDEAGRTVLDVTDATLEAFGEPVVERPGPATELAAALRALTPLLVDRTAPPPPDTSPVEPVPEDAAALVGEASDVASSSVDAAEVDDVEDSPKGALPEPVEPPTSHGRQVLGDVFRLMEE